jgi:hypothetical protein
MAVKGGNLRIVYEAYLFRTFVRCNFPASFQERG